MKLFLLATLLLGGGPLLSWGQALTNEGAAITVQPGTVLFATGAVLNKPGSTLANAGTVQLASNLTNSGTLASTGTLLFSGTGNQTFVPGAAAVAALMQSNTGTSGQNVLSLPASLTVSSQLLLLSGLVRTAPAAILTLPNGAALVGEAPGRYVQGNLRVVRSSGSGVLDFGHGLSLDRTNLGQVTATRTAGLLTDNLSRGVNLSNSALKGIDRIWTVETTTAPTAPVATTLSWLADDDDGLPFSAGTTAQAWRAALASATWQVAGTAAPIAVPAAGRRSFSFATAVLGRLTVSSLAAPLPVATVTAAVAGLRVESYPNPSSPEAEVQVLIQTSQAGPATLQLTDLLGQLVSEQRAQLPAGATTLPLAEASRLATGVYMLRVQQNGQQQTQRLVRH